MNLYVLGDPWFVNWAGRVMDDAVRLIGPGAASCGRTIDNPAGQIVIQPGWEPRDRDRRWVVESVVTRLGPGAFGEGMRMLRRAGVL